MESRERAAGLTTIRTRRRRRRRLPSNGKAGCRLGSTTRNSLDWGRGVVQVCVVALLEENGGRLMFSLDSAAWPRLDVATEHAETLLVLSGDCTMLDVLASGNAVKPKVRQPMRRRNPRDPLDSPPTGAARAVPRRAPRMLADQLWAARVRSAHQDPDALAHPR